MTIWQLTRTKNASIATRSAIERTEKRMALNHLLTLLPQLRLSENDLDVAVFDNDARLAMRALMAYSHTAVEIANLLDRHPQHATLAKELKDAAGKAAETKVAIADASAKAGVKGMTKNFRSKVAGLSSNLSGISTLVAIEMGREN
ncbi:hypothetical protein [Kineosporia sp. NBRC 101731]|uniref:hypothetical protein n=1 Tax=Kineosporia sp. NBRC 101731 TaxID=3032199 RepID=UPI0025521C68|nr:hypothetical protein [Kineosporia sp. NBRC 101731]